LYAVVGLLTNLHKPYDGLQAHLEQKLRSRGCLESHDLRAHNIVTFFPGLGLHVLFKNGWSDKLPAYQDSVPYETHQGFKSFR
jgi:hypothetical protein